MEAADRRKVIVEACLALLLEEEEDAESTRKFEEDLSLAQSVTADEDRVQEATLQERLQARPRDHPELTVSWQARIIEQALPSYTRISFVWSVQAVSSYRVCLICQVLV